VFLILHSVGRGHIVVRHGEFVEGSGGWLHEVMLNYCEFSVADKFLGNVSG
jgi:hypothetical protein